MGDGRNAEPAAAERVLPAWLVSIMFHVVLVMLLGLILRAAPRGAVEEPGRTTGIVLRRLTDDGELYEGEQAAASPSPTAASPTEQASDRLAALPDATAVSDPRAALPQQVNIAAGPRAGDRVGNAGAATAGNRGGRGPIAGGKARLSVFGAVGEGTKFVYVFDRSVSMAGAPLRAAKAELVSSLAALESVHQFQIIFFNHQLRTFDLTGGQRRVAFASEQNKRLAANFVGRITADGGTDRLTALRLAVGMQPDVIFFLTDIDDAMSAGELDSIRRLNRSAASINSIEFGYGPSAGSTNFLTRLARQSGGQYVYVDTSKLGR